MPTDELLAERMRQWVAVATPVGAHEARVRAAGGARPAVDADDDGPSAPVPLVAPTPDRPPRRLRLLAAAIAVLALAAAVLVAVRRPSTDEQPMISNGPPLHRYVVDYASPQDAPLKQYPYVSHGLLEVTATRLYAYGRTDASVVPTADGAALVSTSTPLSPDELHLLLGRQGRLSILSGQAPAPTETCEIDPFLSAGARSGRWPDWGPVTSCTRGTLEAVSVMSRSENDQGLAVLGAGSGVYVGDGTDGTRQITATFDGSTNNGATGGGTPVLDGTAVDGPISVAPFPVQLRVDGLTAERAGILEAILLGGSYDRAVIVSEIPAGDPTGTQPPRLLTDGSSPSTIQPRSSGEQSSSLDVTFSSVGGPAPGARRPLEGVAYTVTDREGATVPVRGGHVSLARGVGRWEVDATAGGCHQHVTIVLTVPGDHHLALTCQIS